jgi:hypothetical protein
LSHGTRIDPAKKIITSATRIALRVEAMKILPLSQAVKPEASITMNAIFIQTPKKPAENGPGEILTAFV